VFPAVMGGQKGIALFYKYFSRLVSFACVTINANEPTEEYTVLNEFPDASSRYINPKLFFKLRKIALENDCTHLLFEHPYYGWMIFLCRLFMPQKLIIHSHNIESERFKSIGKWWWKILWFYEGFAYRQANIVWFKTDEDKHYAELYYKLKPEKCFTIPYGTENVSLPAQTEIEEARRFIQLKHHIDSGDTLILFNGTLTYKPNLEALHAILENINPLLAKEKLSYKILICGKNLPIEMNELKQYIDANIIYCGFVEDIDLYFKGCDIFLNPVQDGGGIKTKLVEALGFGKKCVSSTDGAVGVNAESSGERLMIVADQDWNAYCKAIMDLTQHQIHQHHSTFYASYSWKNIAVTAVQTLL
jgi:glycosyltransferase involved in cell wall biosynthesis